MSNSKLHLLSDQVRAEIDVWIAKYPVDQKQSAVMPALRIVQEDNGGYLSNELMDAIAEYLDMRPISVYEVATFYSMYELKPVVRPRYVCVPIFHVFYAAPRR
jgi:NADH-quinone oxidoreductase subunit E